MAGLLSKLATGLVKSRNNPYSRYDSLFDDAQEEGNTQKNVEDLSAIKKEESEIFGNALSDWNTHLRSSIKSEETLASTDGNEVSVFGEGNLRLLELILQTFKLCKDNEYYRGKFIESQVFDTLKEILKKHKWNNFLHLIFKDLVFECLTFEEIGDNVNIDLNLVDNKA